MKIPLKHDPSALRAPPLLRRAGHSSFEWCFDGSPYVIGGDVRRTEGVIYSKQLLKPLHHFIRRAAGAVGGSGLGPFDEGYVTRSRAIFRAQ